MKISLSLNYMLLNLFFHFMTFKLTLFIGLLPGSQMPQVPVLWDLVEAVAYNKRSAWTTVWWTELPFCWEAKGPIGFEKLSFWFGTSWSRKEAQLKPFEARCQICGVKFPKKNSGTFSAAFRHPEPWPRRTIGELPYPLVKSTCQNGHDKIRCMLLFRIMNFFNLHLILLLLTTTSAIVPLGSDRVQIKGWEGEIILCLVILGNSLHQSPSIKHAALALGHLQII